MLFYILIWIPFQKILIPFLEKVFRYDEMYTLTAEFVKEGGESRSGKSSVKKSIGSYIDEDGEVTFWSFKEYFIIIKKKQVGIY